MKASNATGKISSFACWCDWLTICTYKFEPYTMAVAYLRRQEESGWKRKSWLQYEGFQHKTGVFYGHATQSNKREHYLIKISGNLAGQYLGDILAQGWAKSFYATRIDLERTRQKPEWWKPRELADWLRGEGKKVSMIESEFSTVYIGSRTSGRFTRIYEKDYESIYVRLEIELKKKHAAIAWDYLLSGKSVESLYASHLEKIGLFERAVADYLPQDADRLDLALVEKETKMGKRLEWLKTLQATFIKMLHDHDIGAMTADIFYAVLADYERVNNDNLDKGDTKERQNRNLP